MWRLILGACLGISIAVFDLFQLFCNFKNVLTLLGTLIGLFVIFIIAMTLVAETIIPQLSIWLNKLFLAKSKFKEIITIGLNKHQRQNTMSNTLMVLSFSILFLRGINGKCLRNRINTSKRVE